MWPVSGGANGGRGGEGCRDRTNRGYLYLAKGGDRGEEKEMSSQRRLWASSSSEGGGPAAVGGVAQVRRRGARADGQQGSGLAERARAWHVEAAKGSLGRGTAATGPNRRRGPTAGAAPLFPSGAEEEEDSEGSFAISQIPRGLTVNIKLLSVLGLK